MGDMFTVERMDVQFTPPASIYYKETDIMEYCWNRLTYCEEVDVNEILADAGNILIPKSMPIGRFMEIINNLRRNKPINTFDPFTSEDRSVTMDGIFGEEGTDDNPGMTMDDMFGKADTSDDNNGLTMDDIFGEDDYVDCENFTEDEGITADACCCEPMECYDAFHEHITLADLNSLFSTLNFKPDDSTMGDPEGYDANDSLERMIDSLEDYADIEEELLNHYTS